MTASPAVGPGAMRLPDGPPAAQLDLSFERADDGRTVMTRRHAGYPFHVTAPLQDGTPRALVIVQSASGGLYGAESVRQRIHAGCEAAVTIRFPSATVVQPARDRGPTRLHVTLSAAAGATLTYLPRPLILFPGAVLEQTTVVTVADGARVVLCDGFMLHDPPQATAAPRSLVNHLTVQDAASRRIALDRMRVDDAMIDAALPGAAGGCRAFGTVWAIGPVTAQAASTYRRTVASAYASGSGTRAAASPLSNGLGLVVRIAASDGGALDAALERAGVEAGRVLAAR